MKILCDTSILVEIDRHNETVVQLLQREVEQGKELVISMVTVAEILTGSYLRKDVTTAVITAKEVLNQFLWKEMDGDVAEYCAKLYAYLLLEKKEKVVEYPDVIIAATFLATKSDVLLTLNKKDFLLFPQLENIVFTPEERAKKR